jgi:hypothetical protein
MDVWLQQHDFSTEDLSAKSREECLAILDSYHWEDELAKYEAALEAQRERCPPGMGFVDGNRTLHVMPIGENRSHYHYSCDHPMKLFAIFGATRSLNVWAIPDRHRATLLALHYAGQENDLVRLLGELDAGAAS